MQGCYVKVERILDSTKHRRRIFNEQGISAWTGQQTHRGLNVMHAMSY